MTVVYNPLLNEAKFEREDGVLSNGTSAMERTSSYVHTIGSLDLIRRGYRGRTRASMIVISSRNMIYEQSLEAYT